MGPPASYFADRAFLDSARPKPVVASVNALDARQQLVNIDAIRCRRNICCHSPWDIPVFCAFDEPF